MSSLSELRAMADGVELRGERLALTGADELAQAFARDHKAEIVAELRKEVSFAWPNGLKSGELISFCLGLEKLLAPMIEEADDLACITFGMVQSFRKAVKDHELHGKRWFARYGQELGRRLKALCPELWPKDPMDKVLEGNALISATLRAFPGAQRLPVGFELGLVIDAIFRGEW